MLDYLISYIMEPFNGVSTMSIIKAVSGGGLFIAAAYLALMALVVIA